MAYIQLVLAVLSVFQTITRILERRSYFKEGEAAIVLSTLQKTQDDLRVAMAARTAAVNDATVNGVRDDQFTRKD